MFLLALRFDFRMLVLAHGWAFLTPFAWDEARATLARPLRLSQGQSVPVVVSAAPAGARTRVRVQAPGVRGLAAGDRLAVRAQVARMLRLDEPFDRFHALCRDEPELAFVGRRRCGGLLRTPTAFEDLVKTACTTNCDWNNTKRMTKALCALDPDGNFPEPRTILRYTPRQLARLVPLGYRVRTVREIARRTLAGRLELDQWAAAGDFARANQALRSIWGIGPYAAAHMLVLLGHYEQVPVDSEVSKYLAAAHGNGQPVRPAHALAPYERFRPYQFLAYKFSRIGRKMNYIDTGRESSGRARVRRTSAEAGPVRPTLAPAIEDPI